MKKLTNDQKELIDSVVQRHAPWIQKSIKYLRSTGKISQQFQDDDLYYAGYNALVEALSSYDPSKGEFKTHANNLIKHRLMGHVEREMARGGGGVDRYFLDQARQQKRQSNLENKQQPPVEVQQPTPEPVQTQPIETPQSTELPKQINPPNQPKKL